MTISQLEPDEIRGTVRIILNESLTEEEKITKRKAKTAIKPILGRILAAWRAPLSAMENNARQTEIADAVRNIPGVKEVQVRPLLIGQPISVHMKLIVNMDTGEVEIETESVTNASPKGPDFSESDDVIRVFRQR